MPQSTPKSMKIYYGKKIQASMPPWPVLFPETFLLVIRNSKRQICFEHIEHTHQKEWLWSGLRRFCWGL